MKKYCDFKEDHALSSGFADECADCEKTNKSLQNFKKKKAADTSQLTKLKEPCGLDCVRKWFTLNKYTYTHTAGQGGAEIKGVLVKNCLTH